MNGKTSKLIRKHSLLGGADMFKANYRNQKRKWKNLSHTERSEARAAMKHELGL